MYCDYTNTSSDGPIVTKIYEGFIANNDKTNGLAYSNPTVFFISVVLWKHAVPDTSPLARQAWIVLQLKKLQAPPGKEPKSTEHVKTE